MKKLCWIFTLLFAASTFLLGYKFLWRGEVVPASDGRSAIVLAEGERDLVLGEMRAFLQAVQAIVAASIDGKSDAAAAAARRVGAAAQASVPASLVGKLPAEFKMLGFDTHRKFDALALDAEQLGDTQQTLQQLAELMSNCVACHEAYRIDPATP
jgi:mono/diheme cytochrome c family protein